MDNLFIVWRRSICEVFLNGLQSGTRLQYDLTKAGIKHHHGQSHAVENDRDQVSDDDEPDLLQATAAMFGDLVEELGSPLRALSVCLLPSLIDFSCSYPS